MFDEVCDDIPTQWCRVTIVWCGAWNVPFEPGVENGLFWSGADGVPDLGCPESGANGVPKSGACGVPFGVFIKISRLGAVRVCTFVHTVCTLVRTLFWVCTRCTGCTDLCHMCPPKSDNEMAYPGCHFHKFCVKYDVVTYVVCKMCVCTTVCANSFLIFATFTK